MSKKLIYLVSFILVLGLVGSASADLIGHWKFDEGSGTVAYDVSGNGNDGTINGSPNWVPGVGGSALEFDGSNDYVGTGKRLLDNMSEFTIACWVAAGNPGSSRIGLVGQNDLIEMGFMSGNAEMWTAVTGTTTTAWTFENYTWHHITITGDATSTKVYLDGELKATGGGTSNYGTSTYNVNIGGGGVWDGSGNWFLGQIDDVRIYNHALSQIEIQIAMKGAGGKWPYALGPDPKDGALHLDTWANLSWTPGGFAVSHDVYFSDNFDDVNSGSETAFQGSHPSTYFVVGFPGFPYPDGLVPGTTYYWRIDEVNDTEPNSPWKGDVWSFSIPPKTAYNPVPADGVELVAPDAKLSWTAGFGAKLHYFYFGDNFDDVNNATVGKPFGSTSYNPGPLKLAKTYYWRVDEFDAIATHKGRVWSFTTLGGVGSPNPSNGAVDVKQTQILSWLPGVYAASHQVYFGTDKEAVRNANTSSPEYKGTGKRGAESFEPGKLLWDTTYYWRIDEVNNANLDSPWTGKVWSFTTANYLVVDDFEDYDMGNNEIWWSWKDGLGYAAHGTAPAYPGNGTGSAVGDESTASYCEETIVHGGSQSMPLFYDNSVLKYSEAELTLIYPRDWTEKGVNTLSIWFRGNPAGFVEEPVGTYTMSASGADIWGQSDEFRYAYKQLSGDGEISARVLSATNTDGWVKAGVMIRETLDPGSKHAIMAITPTVSHGVAFQNRVTTSGSSFSAHHDVGLSYPCWVRLVRQGSQITAYYSQNGVNWVQVLPGTGGDASRNPQTILMNANVYIGLALTSHNANATCVAVFSDVKTTGAVSPAIWTHEAIGATMLSNDAEPMYVALNGNAVVVHDNPNASLINEWTEWNIDLQAFAGQGVNLANVNTIALGLGNKKNPVAGGSGTMYFDDIRLYLPAP